MKKYSIQKHIDEIKTNIISNILWYIISLLIGNIALWIPLIQGCTMSFIKVETQYHYMHIF